MKQLSSHPPRGRALALSAGAALAASAAFVAYRDRRTERENPPLGEFLEIDDARLHYLERGQGEPLVLLHGNATMVEDFLLSGLIDRAAERYRVIAFDRPGYGHSNRPGDHRWTPEAQADLIARAFDRLSIEHAIVLGHSWGTLVALAMALRHPASVRALVLLSGYYFPTLRLDAPMMAADALPLIGPLMRHTTSPLLGRAMWRAGVRTLFSPGEPTAGFNRFPPWMALRSSQLRASAEESAMMVPAARTLSPSYAALTVPSVIMAGAGDRIADAHRHSERLHAILRESELRLLPGVGHMIHHSRPDEVMAAIDAAAEKPAMVRPAPFAETAAAPT